MWLAIRIHCDIPASPRDWHMSYSFHKKASTIAVSIWYIIMISIDFVKSAVERDYESIQLAIILHSQQNLSFEREYFITLRNSIFTLCQDWAWNLDTTQLTSIRVWVYPSKRYTWMHFFSSTIIRTFAIENKHFLWWWLPCKQGKDEYTVNSQQGDFVLQR